MSTFHLRVVTSEREFYNGDVDRIIVRTTEGDVGVLAKHVPYVAALGVGGLTIFHEGTRRIAAISGGFMEVSENETVVLARTCEWADEIDVNRAQEAADRAKDRMGHKTSQSEHDRAAIKLKKAINRMRIAGGK